MAYDVPLTTRITSAVDRRLRMLALAESQPLSHVLTGLLDQVLPSADELASKLSASAAGDEVAALCLSPSTRPRSSATSASTSPPQPGTSAETSS
jgi:hypothetical protein